MTEAQNMRLQIAHLAHTHPRTPEGSRNNPRTAEERASVLEEFVDGSALHLAALQLAAKTAGGENIERLLTTAVEFVTYAEKETKKPAEEPVKKKTFLKKKGGTKKS